MRRLLFPLLLALAAAAGASEIPPSNAAEVRAMPREEAAERHPITLEGVVTFRFDRPNGSFVLHDKSAGIFISTEERPDDLAPLEWLTPETDITVGSKVRVTGVTGPGGLAPVVVPLTLEKTGIAPLPEPVPVTLPQLESGRYDCQLVTIEGTVRFAREVERAERAQIDMANSDGRFTLFLSKFGTPEPHTFIDARIRVSAVAFGFFNFRGQLLEPILQAQNSDFIEILAPAPADPFDAPEKPLARIFEFSPDGLPVHRVRTRGTVTYSRPGQLLYLQNEGRALRVTTRLSLDLKPGDYVEASGFPEMRRDLAHAQLSESILRVIGQRPPPEPIEVTAGTPFNFDPDPERGSAYLDLDGLLVTATGTFIGASADRRTLLLETESGTLPVAFESASIPEIELGSTLRATGIARVGLEFGYPEYYYPRPRDFSILATSPETLEILSTPPWWTPARLAVALGISAAVLLAALAWVFLLRKKVAERSAQLAAEIESRHHAKLKFEATLGERKRIAADLHDNLEQALTGVAFQVENMVLHDRKKRPWTDHLPRLHQSLKNVREEFRRAIWNLRSNILEEGDLGLALDRLALRTTEDSGIPVAFESHGKEQPLSPFLANQLLMLAQEAVTNALKHSGTPDLLIELFHQTDAVELRITDHGQGFDPDTSPGPATGHFGIQGMRERAKRIGANIRWKSSNTGTTVHINSPTR